VPPKSRAPAAVSEARSRIMSAIRGRGNQTTELRVAKLLRSWGLRGWRRHQALPGRPDFAWPRIRVALFVDGCFWHGCPKCYRPPSSHKSYWAGKLSDNRARDRRANQRLRKLGWQVIRVWECDVMGPRFEARIRSALHHLDLPNATASRQTL
jgi:DNA mismatch endonuclease, patch repair protein